MVATAMLDETQTKVWDRSVKMWMVRASLMRWPVSACGKTPSDGNLQAKQSGILGDATRSAKLAIQRILLESGMEKVTFSDNAGTVQKDSAPQTR
jgi:hypothetical protein